MTAQQRVHIVAHPQVRGGVGSGTASAVVRTARGPALLVAQARSEALGAGPAQDASPEVPGRPAAPAWDRAPALSAPRSSRRSAPCSARCSPPTDVEHFGYAEHTLTSSYLGTTGGLRLRHDQPAARFELCGKSGGAHAGRRGRDARAAHFTQMDLTGAPAEVRRGTCRPGDAHRRDPGPPAGDAHTVGSRRHAHLPAVVGRGPGRGRGPQRVQPSRGWHPRR